MGRFDRRIRDNQDHDDPAPIIPTTNIRAPSKPGQTVAPQNPKPYQNQGGTPAYTGGAYGNEESTGSSGAPVYNGGAYGNEESDPVSGSGASPGGSNNQGDSESLANQALQELLSGGPRDTSEDQAYIEDMMRRSVGEGQANLNARMAAGGMGTSGALGQMSGDLRAQAAREAAGEVMGVRDEARNEWLRKVQLGLQGEMADRGMDMTEQQWQQYLEILNAMNEQPDVPVEPGSASGSSGGQMSNNDRQSAIYVARIPPGSTPLGDNFYRTPDGQIVHN